MKPGRTSMSVGWLVATAWLAQVACNGTSDNALPSVSGGRNSPDGTSAPWQFSLRIARHEEQSFSTERIDGILAEASELLQTVQTECPDLACPVIFSRDGEVKTFELGSGIITSESHLDEVFRHPADIKIVTLMVGVCGAPSPGDMSVVLGCAFTGGSAVITHDAPTDVWAHEWGHVQGLPHRNDCPANLMHATNLDTDSVNETERDAFLSPTPRSSLFRAAPLPVVEQDPQLTRMPDESIAAWLERILPRRYLSGIPQSIFADSADPQVARALLDRLDVGPQAPYRVNVIRSLGLVGDPVACPFLIAFVEDLRGALTTEDVAAAAEAFLALGRLAGNDPTDATVSYLTEGTEPAVWEERGLTLEGDDLPSDDLADVFARLCIMSLGISQHPAAVEQLAELSQQLQAGRLIEREIGRQIIEAGIRSGADGYRVQSGETASHIP